MHIVSPKITAVYEVFLKNEFKTFYAKSIFVSSKFHRNLPLRNHSSICMKPKQSIVTEFIIDLQEYGQVLPFQN